MKHHIIAWCLVLTLAFGHAEAKKAPLRAHKELIPEGHAHFEAHKSAPQADQVVHLTNLNFQDKSVSMPEQLAERFIRHNLSQQNKLVADDIDLRFESIYHGKALTTVRFQQMHKDLRVYGGQYTVSINQDGVVRHAHHQLFDLSQFVMPKVILDDAVIQAQAADFFNHPQRNLKQADSESMIFVMGAAARLVKRVDYAFPHETGRWELLVDASSGEVIRAKDQMHYVNLDVTVFDPDPLSSAASAYGGGLVDGNDQNTNALSAELFTYVEDFNQSNGQYQLSNQWAQSVDVDAPMDGDFSQASSDFTYHRGEDSFEAVNIYYHLSEFLSYLNNDLDLTVRPFQYSGGVKFDAHAWDGADNSSYTGGPEGILRFGEGCVDDGEDADVIIHELGHGIHDWITNGNLSQVNGLSEGLGDYFAQSYSRARTATAWTVNDPAYHYVFSWDGHNECWDGRVTNYNRSYPSGLVGQIHTDGQIWSTCLMKVWDAVGQEKTDTMVIEGISMTGAQSSQNDAAQAVLQAAYDLGYTSDVGTVQSIFQGCGYDVELEQSILVNIQSSPAQPDIGQSVTFNALSSEGTGPYTYRWDVNGDGVTDGSGQSITVTYSQAYNGVIEVMATDATDATGTGRLNVQVTGPNIQLQQTSNIPGSLTQVCGNNDQVVDPGERWQTSLQVRNTGAAAATDAWLALGKNRSAVSSELSDATGNVASTCARDFINIAQNANAVSWQSAGTQYPANDEGFAEISLADSFDHYGQQVSLLRASTNGYFSTSASSTGDDWDNDCPLPATPSRDTSGGRIAPMHTDLKDAVFYHKSYSSCPRPAESGDDLACEVFLWKGADLWDTTTTTENIDVQAILYPATSQWVYQYAGTGFDGSVSTTGMQNSDASDGLSFACNSAGSLNTTEAVCTFNKNNLPANTVADFVQLESPVISLSDMNVNQSRNVTMNFAIAEDASCGAVMAINHEASVFTEGFNSGQEAFFEQPIGNNGQCQVVTSCGVGTSSEQSLSNDIKPQNGLWWNPARLGNGVDLHVTDKQSMLYVMYTGREDRSPIWYITNSADSAHDQYHNELLEVAYSGGFNSGDQQLAAVGWSNTTFVDPKKAIQVRSINGQLSADLMVFDQFGPQTTPNKHTGHYFSPSENGWGQSVITLGDARVVISYVYDNTGQPMWTISSGPNDSSVRDVLHAKTFCAHCPVLAAEVETVGTLGMELNGQTDGVINQFNVSYPPLPLQPQATWNTTQLPVINAVPPDDQ